ncbi:hypothetical protein CEQ90_02675 [Lewinellaceae bacterium SD302]|nr:hypothetical protein CEQ90_02675 [Lewinellaceae bacterium SD302]
MKNHLFTFLLFVLLTCVTSSIKAQNNGPYHLSLKREMLYGGSGIASMLGGEYLRRRIQPVSIGNVEFDDIIELDELPFAYNRHGTEKLSDYTMYASAGLTSLFLLHHNTRSDFGKISILFGEAMMINAGLTNISKAAFKRPRPYVFDPTWNPNRTLKSSDRASLLSGHTSGAATGSFFFASVFSDYFPDSKLKPVVWGAAITLPALTGYLRVRSARHYPSDVIAGYVLGAAVGYFIPKLHKRVTLNSRLRFVAGPTGFSLTLGL